MYTFNMEIENTRISKSDTFNKRLYKTDVFQK